MKLDFTKLAPVPSGYKILKSREVYVEGEKWENRWVINDFNMSSKNRDWLAIMAPKYLFKSWWDSSTKTSDITLTTTELNLGFLSQIKLNNVYDHCFKIKKNSLISCILLFFDFDIYFSLSHKIHCFLIFFLSSLSSNLKAILQSYNLIILFLKCLWIV